MDSSKSLPDEIEAKLIYGKVRIETGLTLHELASKLSVRHFGGLQFGGIELKICDEVPAVRLSILGLDFLLFEGNVKGRFILRCFTGRSDVLKPIYGRIDITRHMYVFLLEKSEGDYEVFEVPPAPNVLDEQGNIIPLQ